MAIDWANAKVSREEYDQTLRNSVNAYYEHAMNDPSMSKEEVIQSTGEMAENYENAMAEFDAAQEAQATETAETGVESEADASVDGGIDGGDDGGMDGGME